MSDLTINKTVHIHRRISTSGYVAANRKVIPEAKAKIGASISASREMLKHVDELKVYMSSLTGFNPSSHDWDAKTKAYFDSISKRVPEAGLTLNVGYIYISNETKETYLRLEKAITDKYISDIKGLVLTKPEDRVKEKKAFLSKYNALIQLESTHYKYGRPDNVEDYILWRHCLVYGDVANREEDVNDSKKIRFFIFDPEVEKARKEASYRVSIKASTVFNEILGEPIKLRQVLRVHNAALDVNTLSGTDLGMQVHTFMQTNPVKFLEIVKNVDLPTLALINELLFKGIIRRLPNTNAICDNASNDTLANTMSDTIAWFKNDANRHLVSAYTAQLGAAPSIPVKEEVKEVVAEPVANKEPEAKIEEEVVVKEVVVEEVKPVVVEPKVATPTIIKKAN